MSDDAEIETVSAKELVTEPTTEPNKKEAEREADDEDIELIVDEDPILSRETQLDEWNTDFGQTKVYFDGRAVFGADFNMLLCTISLIAVPVGLFFIFVAHYPFEYIIATSLMIMSLSSLVMTGSTDPGIMIKQPPPLSPPTEITRDNEDGTIEKWCRTCNIWRSERGSHCPYCGNCVHKFDHHCSWTGTCIGLRNYRFFVTFLLTTSLLALFISVCCVIELNRASDDDNSNDAITRFFSGANKSLYLAPIILIYALCILCCVCGMCFQHSSLIIANRTTKEDLRYVERSYDKGVVINLTEVFCDDTPSAIKEHLKLKKSRAAEGATFSGT